MDARQPTVTNPWGRHRPLVDDELRVCEDYVRQMRSCLSGDTEPTRRFVIERAHYLHLAATQLVRTTQDVERSIGTCNTAIEPTQHSKPYDTVCTLPAGHTGDHDAHPPLTSAERVREEARHIAAQTDSLTHRLAWLTTDIDRLTAGGQPLDPNHRRLLQELTTKLTALSHDTARLAKDTTDLLPTPERAAAPAGHQAPTVEPTQPAPSPPQRVLER